MHATLSLASARIPSCIMGRVHVSEKSVAPRFGNLVGVDVFQQVGSSGPVDQGARARQILSSMTYLIERSARQA